MTTETGQSKTNWQRMIESSYDLMILDFSWNGSYEKRFTREDLDELRGAGAQRLLLCYLSIGEAERYRPYWQQTWIPGENPGWLGAENPHWIGNYKVRYWHPEWQTIMLGYLLTIIAQGFDGVYFDVVDACFYWSAAAAYGSGGEEYRPGDPRGDEREAAERMIEFMNVMSGFARSWDPEFVVFMQNAEKIVEAAGDRALAKLWKSIDGLGTEDLFYYGAAETDNPANPGKDYRLRLTNTFVENGKTVLSTEYLTDPNTRTVFCDLARGNGHIPFAAPSRYLDRYQAEFCPTHEDGVR